MIYFNFQTNSHIPHIMVKLVCCLICGLEINNNYFAQHHRRKHPNSIPQRGYSKISDPSKINCKFCHKPISKKHIANHIKLLHNKQGTRRYNISI